MTQRILDGLQKAAVVFYTTQHIRSQIEAYGLVDSTRLVQAPLGIAPEFTYQSDDSIPPGIAAAIPSSPYLLHVGSCIPRKRIDVLLNIIAGVRAHKQDFPLVKVGGEFTREQRDQIRHLGLDGAIVHITNVSRNDLAALYRRSTATLVTSDREGFGLPVIEALACGSIVIANDLPPLREAGGPAAIYIPITDVDEWIRRTLAVIDAPDTASSIDMRLAQARQFSWELHAKVILDAYQRLAKGLDPAAANSMVRGPLADSPRVVVGNCAPSSYDSLNATSADYQ
jgi:glycosyltransferase involved in cell wall biosynthesis